MLPCGAYICDILLTRVHSRVARARHSFTAEETAPPWAVGQKWKRTEQLPQQRANQPLGLAHVLRTLRADFAAASILVSLPVALLFLFFQKFLIEGLAAGGVKG